MVLVALDGTTRGWTGRNRRSRRIPFWLLKCSLPVSPARYSGSRACCTVTRSYCILLALFIFLIPEDAYNQRRRHVAATVPGSVHLPTYLATSEPSEPSQLVYEKTKRKLKWVCNFELTVCMLYDFSQIYLYCHDCIYLRRTKKGIATLPQSVISRSHGMKDSTISCWVQGEVYMCNHCHFVDNGLACQKSFTVCIKGTQIAKQ